MEKNCIVTYDLNMMLKLLFYEIVYILYAWIGIRLEMKRKWIGMLGKTKSTMNKENWNKIWKIKVYKVNTSNFFDTFLLVFIWKLSLIISFHNNNIYKRYKLHWDYKGLLFIVCLFVSCMYIVVNVICLFFSCLHYTPL